MTLATEKTNYTDSLLSWKFGPPAYYGSVVLLFLIALAGVFIRNDIFRARWAFVALCLALLPAAGEKLTGILFPWPMKFLISLSLILHMAGGIFGFYFSLYPIYDKIGHLTASITIAFLLFIVILVIGKTFELQLQRSWIVWGIFLSMMVFGLAWEYAELFIDLSSGTTYFVTPYDSVFDMIFNIIGSVYVVTIVNGYLKTASADQLCDRFISWRK
jgi:hypothetical protein